MERAVLDVDDAFLPSYEARRRHRDVSGDPNKIDQLLIASYSFGLLRRFGTLMRLCQISRRPYLIL